MSFRRQTKTTDELKFLLFVFPDDLHESGFQMHMSDQITSTRGWMTDEAHINSSFRCIIDHGKDGRHKSVLEFLAGNGKTDIVLPREDQTLWLIGRTMNNLFLGHRNILLSVWPFAFRRSFFTSMITEMFATHATTTGFTCHEFFFARLCPMIRQGLPLKTKVMVFPFAVRVWTLHAKIGHHSIHEHLTLRSDGLATDRTQGRENVGVDIDLGGIQSLPASLAHKRSRVLRTHTRVTNDVMTNGTLEIFGRWSQEMILVEQPHLCVNRGHLPRDVKYLFLFLGRRSRIAVDGRRMGEHLTKSIQVIRGGREDA